MDLDNFGYPFLAGRSILNPKQRQILRGGNSLPEQYLLRVKNMLFACAHPSCRAVVFRTETARRSAEAQISAIGLRKFSRDFLVKSQVVYPAQAPASKRKVMGKWKNVEARCAPLTIIFCGRDFAVKNGDLALEVFAHLLGCHPAIRLIYIGRIPEDRQRAFADVLKRLEHYHDPPRAQVLAHLAESHILLHPSWSESLGIIYLEAFAAGLAVIGAYGEQLRHIPEILNPEGARVVDFLEGGRTQWVRSYVSMLQSLIESPDIAKRMGCCNYDLVASHTGKFSIACRDKALNAAYRTFVKGKVGLRMEELPNWKDSVLFSMDSDEIQVDFAKYAAEVSFSGCNLVA